MHPPPADRSWGGLDQMRSGQSPKHLACLALREISQISHSSRGHIGTRIDRERAEDTRRDFVESPIGQPECRCYRQWVRAAATVITQAVQSHPFNAEILC